MKSLLIIFLTVFSLQAFSQTIINDKNAAVRDVVPFTAIKVSGGIDIYLSQSDEYALAVSASDENVRDAIRTEVKNGVLNIWFDGGRMRLNGDKKLRAYVSFKKLESLEASGACEFIFSNTYTAMTAKIKLSGASDIKGKIDINNLQLDLSGASTVKVNGNAQNIKIDASGASDIKNYDLVVDNCIADISGASDVRITVNKSLSAKASGASSLYYKGNPEKKDVSSSGASNIAKRD